MQKFLVFFLILTMLSGCSLLPSTSKVEAPAPQQKKVNTIANSEFGVGYVKQEPFNPLTTKNKENLELFGLVYEGLFELDQKFAPQNILCESYEMDGNTYRIHLRPGITFSDGSALTADDVVYSLRLAKQESSYFASRLKDVNGISASGDTVNLTLSRYLANLPCLLDIPIIKENSGKNSTAIGTGPYTIEYNGSAKEYYLSARHGWHGKMPVPFTKIKMVETGGIDELIFNFETGNIDLVTLDPTAPVPLQFRGEYETREYDTSIMVYLGFNTRRAPFSDSVVRQAVACAIDRKSAVEQDYARMAVQTHLPIHPSASAYDKQAAKNFDYSLTDALAFLKNAGYRDENGDGKVDSGGKRSFDILVNNENKSRVALARRIATNLRELGFSINVREEKWEDYNKSLQNVDFDLYLTEVNMTGDFNLDTLIRTGAALNYGRYSSDEMDNNLNTFNGATLTSNSTTQTFYRNFVIQAPIVPILYKKNTVSTHRDFFAELKPTQRNTYYHFYEWKRMSS